MIRLDTIESTFGTITVFKRKSTGTITYEQGGCCQSEADSNGISLASYIHAIFGLILQIRARKVLLIGCAGGTLATMLARAGCKVTVIDVNPASFALAKKYFALPDNVVCQVADAKIFLRSDTQVYDAIVLDAFHGDHVPSHLRSLGFYCLVREHLAQRGAVFVNVHAKHEFDDRPDHVADCMSDIFHDVRLLDSAGTLERNAVAMAGAVSRLHAPSVIVPPLADRDTIESELATMNFRAWRSRP
jgi:spermidine synthase